MQEKTKSIKDHCWIVNLIFPHFYRPEFEKLLAAGSVGGTLNAAQKFKLLNVNAVAEYLTPDYNGPSIESSSNIKDVQISYRKGKQVLVNGLIDTLKNLFTDQSYVRTEHNTGMGLVVGK